MKPSNAIRDPSIKKQATVCLLLIPALGAALRIYGISWSLPHTYEEATPLRVAIHMWGWQDNGQVVNGNGLRDVLERPHVDLSEHRRRRPMQHELRALMERYDGNKAKLARHWGVARSTLYRWLADTRR
jgi:DNA-binding NtrC family response regulator